MKIALVQMDSTGEREENEKRTLRFMRQAVLEKTDVICLSESFVYWGSERSQRNCSLEDIQKYQDCSKENNFNLVLGSVSLINEGSEKTTNTCFVIDRNGKIVHRYDKKYMYKVNKTDLVVDETQKTLPGNANGIFELDGVKMGVGICFDLRYPEYFRELIKEGAEIILLPSHFRKATGEIAWDILTKARAIEKDRKSVV